MDDTVEALAMTDNELYQIVKDYPEDWPEVFETMERPSGGVFIVRKDDPPIGRVYVDEDEPVAEDVMMLFEASFHRKLLAKTDVYAFRSREGRYTVQVRNKDFEAPSLIEAYALALNALEWLK
jgi:hypothetical protein